MLVSFQSKTINSFNNRQSIKIPRFSFYLNVEQTNNTAEKKEKSGFFWKFARTTTNKTKGKEKIITKRIVECIYTYIMLSNIVDISSTRNQVNEDKGRKD